MNATYIVEATLAMAAVTFALRALPFVAGQWLHKHPSVERLGKALPLAIMTLLLLHSGTAAALDNPRGPWAELLAVALVGALQWRFRHPLLSILAGTVTYVALRNWPF
jgi:branched-subunit amino acid transport protein AzlD